MFQKILREPLVHFLILGALLLFASNLINKRTSGDTRKIVITPGQVEHLEDSFARAHQRPPDPDELKGLIRDYVREEVYYREALALGLDRDDAPIRQRLRQKMEFISEDVAAQAQPTGEQLRSYLSDHPEKFRIDKHFTFTQVYLDPVRHGRHLKSDAQQMLAQLNKSGPRADVSNMGDPFLLEGNTENVSSRDVAREYGEKFAASLAELPIGKWAGPVESGLGMHLVCVTNRTDGRLPQLDEVREAVRREWANDYRLESNRKFYEALLNRYTVTVELPSPPADPKSPAAAVRRP
jgi:PPIC-type PPIASE domain